MEKRAMTIICRLSAVLVVLGLTAITAQANSLLNPGFETLSPSNTAANWTQFNVSGVSQTNNTLFPITAHSGANSMQTQPPANTNFDASGAFQDVVASPGQNWRLTGYILNWQNSQLGGPGTFATAQLAFLDSTNGIISTFDAPHFGFQAPFALNVWTNFEVDATAPANTAHVRTYVLYVGDSAGVGSAYFDDLNLYNPVGGSNTSTAVTVTPAVQVSWPTSASITNQTINYQIQSTTNLVFTNLPPVNVLSNGGFEIGAVSNAADSGVVSGWALQGGGSKLLSCAPKPTHSGIGAIRLNDTTTAVPVVDQGGPFSAAPHAVVGGQIWDLQGYGYNSGYPGDTQLGGSAFALLKIVWNDVNGTALQPVGNDPALIGSAVTGGNPGIESLHMTAATPVNTWTFLEARDTAPTNAAFAVVFMIEVGISPGGTVRFDDLTFAQPTTTFGWANLGPVWPGTGATNNISDLINTNKQNFYRVTTQ